MGRTGCLVRAAWAERYGLTTVARKRDLTDRLMCQLSLCKSDEARRLLLKEIPARGGVKSNSVGKRKRPPQETSARVDRMVALAFGKSNAA